jgi:hypothetical protein
VFEGMRARVLALAAGVVGSAAAIFITRQLKRRARDREAQKSFQEEPVDAVLIVEEYFDTDALGDVDTMVALGEQPGVEPGLSQLDVAEMYGSAGDTGELYGVHTMRGVDTEHPDDDRAQAHGENWVEALQESAIENGPEPEAILVFLDEADLDTPPSDNRDRPVADRGSGGRGGL